MLLADGPFAEHKRHVRRVLTTEKTLLLYIIFYIEDLRYIYIHMCVYVVGTVLVCFSTCYIVQHDYRGAAAIMMMTMIIITSTAKWK